MQTAFGYIRIDNADEIHFLHNTISEYAAVEGMELATIYVDQEPPSTEAVHPPGLTTLLEAVGRSERAVVLVPDITHLSHSPEVRRAIGDEVVALGGAVVPLPPPPRTPRTQDQALQVPPGPAHRQESSSPRRRQSAKAGKKRLASPIVRVAVERFPAVLSSVPAARAATVRVLRQWGVNAAAIETATLVMSELTSNATKASGADDLIAFRLTASDGQLVVEVWDNSDDPPVLTDASSDEESGRGLFLIEAFSIRWSWYRPKSGGKVVWSALRADMMQTVQPVAIPGSSTELERRSAEPVAAPVRPVTFQNDPALLRRVIDGLRALDDWHLPASPAHRGATPAPSRVPAQRTPKAGETP
ncbi:ATP-binding protein [Frankia sp. KB5]|uniref:ATP-binding protein n=1 Tax=Frankia sp. KB5 TaxID=683318 RepID=UPI000A114883|nr:ATP-binding protein [Frankia sp. KB5]ORT46926.1 hypothetical protein KBI5_22545 [Frankia sp. KB5]